MPTLKFITAIATASFTTLLAFEPVKAQNSTAIDTTYQESIQEMVIEGVGNRAYQGTTQTDVSDIDAASYGGGSSQVVGGTNQKTRQTGGIVGVGNVYEQINNQQRRRQIDAVTVGGGNSTTGSLTDQNGSQSGVIFGTQNSGSQIDDRYDLERVGAGAGLVK